MFQSLFDFLSKLYGKKLPAIQTSKGIVIPPDTDNEFYSLDGKCRIRIKDNIEIASGEDQDGGHILFLRNNAGSVKGLQCRCPKGFTGLCIAEVEQDELGSWAECEGECTHKQTGEKTQCVFIEVEIPGASAIIDQVFK